MARKTNGFSQEYSLASEVLLISPEAEVSPEFFFVLMSLVPSAVETPILSGIRKEMKLGILFQTMRFAHNGQILLLTDPSAHDLW